MTLRQLLDQLTAVLLASGGDIPVLTEEGQALLSVEYNDDEGPCVILILEGSSGE